MQQDSSASVNYTDNDLTFFFRGFTRTMNARSVAISRLRHHFPGRSHLWARSDGGPRILGIISLQTAFPSITEKKRDSIQLKNGGGR